MSAAARAGLAARAGQHFAAHGITAACDADTRRASLTAYAEADERGVLGVRVAGLVVHDEADWLLGSGLRGRRSPRLAADAVKIWADGGMSSRTAAIHGSYPVPPCGSGILSAAPGELTALYLRQHYMTPLLTSKPNLPGSAWLVNQWYTKGGKFAFPARGSQIVSAVQHFCPPRRNVSLSPAQCLSQHGYTWWASYQPGSRFWPFQWIEGGWLLALSALLIAATVRLVRRRAA